MNLWYVLYCKAQDVGKITKRVNGLGVSVFCPRYVRVSHRTDCNSVRIEEKVLFPKEGANKQVISSQADSLIKISRIWADFFPANTSNQPI